MKKLVFTLIVLFFSVYSYAQDDEKKINSTNEATLIGIGKHFVKDTYLSPLKYDGWGLRVLNERIKRLSLGKGNVSRQQLINVDFSSTLNPSETARTFTGFVDYSLGYHYRFNPIRGMSLLVGASAQAQTGFIYNTRNGNNPASAKLAVNLNASALLLYTFKIKNYPLTFRYQLETPFVGAAFSPHYGQSYYEIFSLGNHDDVVKFTSFHNQLAFKNYVTLDFPVKNFTIRTGLMNSSNRMSLNGIKSHTISNSFMIGFVREFISFGGKRQHQSTLLDSAYY